MIDSILRSCVHLVLSHTALMFPIFAESPATAKPIVETQSVVKTKPGLMNDGAFEALIGKPFVDFEFKDLAGRTWRSGDLKGKIVYINVWFTGCPPCIKEIPSLNALYQSYKDNPKVVLLSVTFDPEEALRPFLKKNPMDMPLSSIPFELIQRMAMPKKIISFPTHLIIDAEGNLAAASTGGSPDIGKDIRASIEECLEKRQGCCPIQS